MRGSISTCLVFLIIMPALSGCFGNDRNTSLNEDDLTISPEILTGAAFQLVEVSAQKAMSVHVPYFILD